MTKFPVEDVMEKSDSLEEVYVMTTHGTICPKEYLTSCDRVVINGLVRPIKFIDFLEEE